VADDPHGAHDDHPGGGHGHDAPAAPIAGGGHGHGAPAAPAAHAHEHPPLEPAALAPGDPGPRGVETVDPDLGAGFLPDGRTRAALEPAENPGPEASFGALERFVEVSFEPREGAGGTLVMPIGRDHPGVAHETLRLFRWDEDKRGFELVEPSGLGGSRDYLWGRVTEPGLYGPIGVSTDPLVARTLAVLAQLQELTALDGLGGRDFLGGRICQLILCSRDFGERMGDPEFARRFVESNLRLGLPVEWGSTGFPDGGGPVDPGGICEKCLGIGLDRPTIPGKLSRPPELQLLPKLCLPKPREVGRWEVLPVVPSAADTVLAVHAGLLGDGRIIYFGGDENVPSQNQAGGAAIDNTRVFDPRTGTVDKVGSPPGHDLFCCGQALLPDGRLLAAGGTKQFPPPPPGHPYHDGHFEGARDSAVFDPTAPAGTNPWTVTAPLVRERGKNAGGGAWYPTLITLPNGRVVRVSGHPEYGDTRHNNLTLETFDPAAASWVDEGAGADLPSTPGVDAPLYPRLHVLPDGHLLCATPLMGATSWKWNLSTKAWASVGSGPGAEYGSFDTSSALLPLHPAQNYRARVLMTNREQAKIIDFGAAAPVWQPTAGRPLVDPQTGAGLIRFHATAVLLPDASVLVIGGHSDPQNWQPPVLTAERFDPGSGSWSAMATAVVPRVYHSVALLLPDGRVWTAGSDYGGGNHEPRMEVYSPPYLFKGPRPTIAQAPGTLTVGATFTISCPQAQKIRTVCLLRCGSSTHAFNSDQRYVGLVIQSQAATALDVAAPPNLNVAPPGFYLLFVVDDQGVPSTGSFIRLQ
jgi:hypothetical protein